MNFQNQGGSSTLSANEAGQEDRSVSLEFLGSLTSLSTSGAGHVDRSVNFEIRFNGFMSLIR